MGEGPKDPLPHPPRVGGHLLSKAVQAIALRRPLLRHLRERGIQTCLWVLNEEGDFAEAFGAGASGVVTDYPSLLRAYLEAQPAPPHPP
ncbi:lysophospholipase D GDPD3-like, partial [Myiozetetes cayanensis]|uniref:lysophospholipase D GDPD3-like n=1 Tax=Myiozetetes cayanensis TaxID=478635 RepID=UPI00215FE17B